jgi:hypothetical protein
MLCAVSILTTLKYCRQKQSGGRFIICYKILFFDSACDILLSDSIGVFLTNYNTYGRNFS